MIKKWQSSITYIFLIFYKQLWFSWYTPSIKISPVTSLLFDPRCVLPPISGDESLSRTYGDWPQIDQSTYLISSPTRWCWWQPVRCASAARVGVPIFIASTTTVGTPWPCLMWTGSVNGAIWCRIKGRLPVLTRMPRRLRATLCK